ncbi:ABC transporter ATP-binding protein [Ectobacillus polymachus]|uniref:ABC transporter ATP-binding protein n=1 Tax=Ectobacillus polymachus TaxID=1508806 RepID=UPI003A86FF05
MASVQLAIENLTKLYPTGEGVKNINIDIQHGEMVSLLGPSGCGKTTVLRSVGGFIKPDSGDIKITGESVLSLPPEKRPTAMVFQSYNLWPHMTVFDNLGFSLKLKKVPKAEIKKKVEWALELVQLPGAEKKYPSELSGGQQQRIAVARTLIMNPKVLLLDEPFSALDAKLRHELRAELREIQAREKLTMLFVTHDQEEALSISDKIVVMNKGKIEQIATPQEIYTKPASLFVAQFIGKMNFISAVNSKSFLEVGPLRLPTQHSYSGNVTIGVRPEDVVLVKEKNQGMGATVTKVMMLGHYAEITLHTLVGSLKMFVDRNNITDYHIGQSILITFSRFQIFSEQIEEKIQEAII